MRSNLDGTPHGRDPALPWLARPKGRPIAPPPRSNPDAKGFFETRPSTVLSPRSAHARLIAFSESEVWTLRKGGQIAIRAVWSHYREKAR